MEGPELNHVSDPRADPTGSGASPKSTLRPIQLIPVSRIRPEMGLGRQRDREGHKELQRSIAKFGVLTPITVRPANDETGDFLLVKGQGRTLACRLLGLETIPALVVEGDYPDEVKVQQFLVENVARMKLRPVERALLIQRARQAGEETNNIARRFGISPATVRRLLSQLEEATGNEVSMMEEGCLSLASHAQIVKNVHPDERSEVLEILRGSTLNSRDLEALFSALGWRRLGTMGRELSPTRLALFSWAVSRLEADSHGSIRDRLSRVAERFPLDIEELMSGMQVAR